MKFEQYHIAEGIKAAIDKQGYKKPTDIQYKTIPHILKGEDVLAIAQTGTGKTAAFAIPILDILLKRKIKSRPDGVKCLVMAPTHELAIQIDQVFKSLGKNTRVETFCIHGGVDQEPQIAKLNKGIDVLIATPGRLFDLVSQGALKLHRVEILVLDEADHMLDLGFIKDIRDLMRHLPKKKQTLFFSATINEKIKKLAYSLVSNNAIRIQVSPKNPVAKNIEHAVAFIEMDDKRFFLEHFINEHEAQKMLVFVRTKVRAERVKKAMERVNITTDTIHSDRSQEDRSKTMQAYRKGDLKVLIATDVSARGIDIPNVEYVVNYDLPEAPESYVHRVGRTGRGTQKGQAITFCSEEETALLEMIEENLGKPIERLEISSSDYQYTLDISEDRADNWQALMKEAQQAPKDKK
ncbi:DEAD/DEAH box helicase, partial [Fulvivirga sp. RKSG066]|uniref:DEAD/DEAH box helicase n=1 Tax=Fulvivirga aurantia TaxID=2529383 RepID=UPI0012BC6C36